VPDQIKGLVVGELLELRPGDPSDSSSATGRSLRRAEQAVAGLVGVLEVQTYGDLLHVFVDSADRRPAALRRPLSRWYASRKARRMNRISGSR